jgi:hypothetical protein
MLCEVSGDCVGVTQTKAFYSVWEAIDKHPQIEANGHPKEDDCRALCPFGASLSTAEAFDG